MPFDVIIIEFSLRWTNAVGLLGLNGLILESKPQLVGVTAAENHERANRTTLLQISRRFKGCDAQEPVCLTVGMLPFNQFPRHGQWEMLRREALVYKGPSTKVSGQTTFRGHRLRLDRYDEVDFENMVASLKSEGLWLLSSSP